MLLDLKKQIISFLNDILKAAYPAQDSLPVIELERPADKKFGDFSCNVALKSAKLMKKPPVAIADEFVKLFNQHLEKSPLKDKIARIEVKAPGFINFFLSNSAYYDLLTVVIKQKENYGRLDYGKKDKIQIEFVSANPTGPLSVAHARQAVVGDVLASIYNFIGFNVCREYYVNDSGNQIRLLGESVRCRILEILGEPTPLPEEGYQGDYIKDMAQIFIDANRPKNIDEVKNLPNEKLKQFAVDYLLAIIKQELLDFGVNFDVWSFESKIASKENVAAILELLKKKGHIYEQDGALWFRSTTFGDDKDRVVKKSDGSYTYLAPDIVYHKNKFERGFKRVFNIWGPDHHGYIPRIKAAAQALGENKDALEVLIVQLATIYRDGQAVSMSTRKGQYISLREVMDEVGKDAARFFFLMRHISMHLEFDLSLAKKETPENPVYYIQYAHARINSINKKAKELNIKEKHGAFTLLKEPEEIDLLKLIGLFPEILIFCYEQLDSYPLISYLQDLATCFHKFYDCHRVVEDANLELSAERLALINAAKIVLANGLRLLGVTIPEKM